jgi:asparaginyl-tRNA synthetase
VDWRALPLRTRLKNIVESSFARITYTEAIELLQKAVEDGVKFEEVLLMLCWGFFMLSARPAFLILCA